MTATEGKRNKLDDDERGRNSTLPDTISRHISHLLANNTARFVSALAVSLAKAKDRIAIRPFVRPLMMHTPV